MGMLDRYRKSGGFIQLLKLVETCGPAKREKFMELIRAENAAWADALKQKMLNMERIYGWPEEPLAELFGTLQDLTVGTALLGTTEENRLKIKALFTNARWRKIEEIFAGKAPTPAEVATQNEKIMETIRKMVSDGHLRFDKFDPELAIETDIEEKLNKINTAADVIDFKSDFTIEYDTPPEKGDSGASDAALESRIAELSALRKKLAEISKENAVLRHELSLAKGKLEQIRKIA